MPFDSKGKHHMNAQRAARESGPRTPTFNSNAKHDEAAVKEENPGQPEGEEGSSTSLHEHGDGTFHTEGQDGERTEHPSFGHAMMHMASKHGGGGTHMHIHHDGIDHTTHHHSEGGEVEGPHSHGSTEEIKEHVGMVFDGGGNEMGSKGQEPHGKF
jgi:hypothetical protein